MQQWSKALGWLTIHLAFCASLPTPAAANDEGGIRYTVRKGDSLISLGRLYLRQPQSYSIVQRQNRIADAYRIPVGRVIIFPRDLLKYRPASARLISVRGSVLAGVAGNAPMQARVGQTVAEGMAISTAASSFVTLQLEDGSRVSLPSNSNVRIRRLRHYNLGGSIDYDFDVARGGIRSSVVKLKSAEDRYRVRTPKAVSAVRGTDFQSRFDPESGSDFAEVVEGALGVAAGNSAAKALPAGNGLAVKPGGDVVTEELLPPPALRSPGRLQADSLVRFTAETSGPVRYSVALDAGFVEQIADVITPDGNAAFEAIPNGNYFVRARALSANAIQGLPATFAFKRRLNSVTASAGKADEGYAFRWSGDGEGTQRFHFQLFKGSPTAVPMVDEAGLTSDRILISDLPPGDYQWRVGIVQYLDGEVAINWTPLEKLTVSAD